ncbi:hypothetical protein PENTCL1PPCAC_12954, partial [Pristionchus entomophagus]
SSLLLLTQIMDTTVDSSLLMRFLAQCLPYLVEVGQLTPHLSVYSSTVALFLTARCFQSHLTLNVMGIWPVMKERMSEFVKSLCPMHWQTRRLATLFELELPQGICGMSHGCVCSDLLSIAAMEKEVKEILGRLIQSKEWTEGKLTIVADLVGDMMTQLGTQSIRDWWRERLVKEITSGSRSVPMLRLLSLTVYRGVIEAEEMMERIMEGMRADEIYIVDSCLSMLLSLLVGGSNRNEEELLVEGSIGGEIVARAIREIVKMSSQHSSSSIRDRCTMILARSMKRQYAKRVMREEIDKEWMREENGEAGLAEAYHQLTRKCSSSTWNGLEIEEGGRGLRELKIFDAAAVRREMQWILVKDHSSISIEYFSM